MLGFIFRLSAGATEMLLVENGTNTTSQIDSRNKPAGQIYVGLLCGFLFTISLMQAIHKHLLSGLILGERVILRLFAWQLHGC